MVKPCVAHSDKASEFEGRCFPSGINNALSAFQWSGDFEEMDKLFNVSKRVMDSKGQPALRWSNIMMRPMITFTEVRQFPVWERGDDPSIAEVMDLLERNVAVFKSELQALKRGGHFSAAYDHLVGRGTWSKVSLFTDGLWSEEFCAVARESCRLLRNGLPGRSREVPYAVMNHEEVVFFYSSPGSRVLPHNGAQNGRINVHIGLEGFEASRIVVHTGINQTRSLSWSDSEAVAFNDGWIHEVVNGESDERYVLALGIMHPDIWQGRGRRQLAGPGGRSRRGKPRDGAQDGSLGSGGRLGVRVTFRWSDLWCGLTGITPIAERGATAAACELRFGPLAPPKTAHQKVTLAYHSCVRSQTA
ncbi:unnamed protein product [Prorocentrum cordatum]|uniref:Aspartyl/asparaginy/proline hydroxylase domain-containing protein n=1 Tax=Prorocentrum cordatum TaxID=2364126 RepID=A0ABN9RLV8_9DINO|nr:unnamed protein product [Polarella glacialis]